MVTAKLTGFIQVKNIINIATVNQPKYINLYKQNFIWVKSGINIFNVTIAGYHFLQCTLYL